MKVSEINALKSSDFEFPGQKKVYNGKVRDVYYIDDDLLVMIASDRISAFDRILPRAIPFKGQVLNQIASRFLKEISDIVPNWLLDTPDPNVSIGRKCEPYKVEMVIRGYLSGHAWREYRDGKRTICGVDMPEGMRENDAFPEPIITPATKADEGHDEDISGVDIVKQGLVPEEEYRYLEEITRKLFKRGTEIAAKRGLILVDTKYEFGKYGDEILLMDEIHTPDSSRYFYKEGYQERQQKGEKQKQLSKEFVREWLISQNFQGLEGQMMPEMNDERVQLISDRYIELYEQLIGESFQPAKTDNIHSRIVENVNIALKSLRG